MPLHFPNNKQRIEIMSSKVLLVDDDDLLTELLTEYLTAEGLDVTRMPDGESGVQEILGGNHYDVVVLDSMMPKMNGLDVLKTVRAQSKIPVIMLTAKGDDILRRSQQNPDANAASASIVASGVTLFPSKRQAMVGDSMLELTSTEFNLLEVLMRHAGQVVSKENLSQEALDRKLAKFDRSIDVHISSIRHKLGDASLIQTVRGLGYLFVKN